MLVARGLVPGLENHRIADIERFQPLRTGLEALRQQKPVGYKSFEALKAKAYLYIINKADVNVGFPSLIPKLVTTDFKPSLIHIWDAHKLWEGDVLPCFAFYPESPKIMYGTSPLTIPSLYSARHPLREPIVIRATDYNITVAKVSNPNPLSEQFYMSTFRRLSIIRPQLMLRLVDDFWSHRMSRGRRRRAVAPTPADSN
jgi:hypothetical protein